MNENDKVDIFFNEDEPITEGAAADCTECKADDTACYFDKPVNTPPLNKRVATAAVDLIDIVCSAIFLMLVLFIFVFKYVTVIGNSMKPTLHNQDKLIITSIFYTPKQGDIVVIDVPGEDEPLIKRIIATEGQTVTLDTEIWRVLIDGIPLEEDYQINITDRSMNEGVIIFPYKVEPGKVFVMGDNRNDSKDSRIIGAVDASKILGKVVFRLSPVKDIGIVK